VPKVESNVESKLVGNLALNDKQEKALVAFLLLLTDGFEQNP
jgi:hypothetical protein